MKKLFLLTASVFAFGAAAPAQAHGCHGYGCNHHHHDDVDAGDAFIIGVLFGLLSSTTLHDAVDDDYSRVVLNDVALSILTEQENELVDSVMAEMEGSNETAKKEQILKAVEGYLAQ